MSLVQPCYSLLIKLSVLRSLLLQSLISGHLRGCYKYEDTPILKINIEISQQYDNKSTFSVTMNTFK